MRIAAHDAFNTPIGGFDVLPSDSTSSDVGAWVELAADEVEVPARSSVDVPFRLVVPSNASPGDHAGGIVASLSVPTTAADGTELLVDHRVGTRIYIRVAGPLRPALVVSSLDLRFEPEGLLGTSGAAVTTYTVRNSGNIRMSAKQALAVEGPFGLGAHTVELTALPELLPGGEYTGTVTIDDVRSYGRLSATLTLETSTTPPEVIEASSSVWAVPWRALGVAALVVGWLVWRRRSRRTPSDRPDDAAGPAEPAGSGDAGEAAPESSTAPTVAGAWLAMALLIPIGSTAVPDEDTATAQAVQLDTAVASIGDTVGVSLFGWPPGPAQVELCGNAAQRGSVDCGQLGTVAAAVREDGTATANLSVARPPSDCPCVVRVSQVHSGAAATVPIELVGLEPLDPAVGGGPSAAPSRTIAVTVGDVVADEGYGAWFGSDVGRQMNVAVRNEGSVRLDDVTVSARLTGGLGTSVVIDSPVPFDLEPGEERLVTLVFELPAPAIGDYRVEGRADGGDEPVTFSATTSHMPWGLVNALVLFIVACVVFSARRRRRRSRPPARPSAAPPPPAPLPAPPESAAGEPIEPAEPVQTTGQPVSEDVDTAV